MAPFPQTCPQAELGNESLGVLRLDAALHSVRHSGRYSKKTSLVISRQRGKHALRAGICRQRLSPVRGPVPPTTEGCVEPQQPKPLVPAWTAAALLPRWPPQPAAEGGSDLMRPIQRNLGGSAKRLSNSRLLDPKRQQGCRSPRGSASCSVRRTLEPVIRTREAELPTARPQAELGNECLECSGSTQPSILCGTAAAI